MCQRFKHEIKTGRNKVGKVETKCISFLKQKRVREVRRYRDAVVTFMERDDNSRMLPGKADKVKTGVHESTQTRVLTDYLSNLHTKFLSENPNCETFVSFLSENQTKAYPHYFVYYTR